MTPRFLMPMDLTSDVLTHMFDIHEERPHYPKGRFAWHCGCYWSPHDFALDEGCRAIDAVSASSSSSS